MPEKLLLDAAEVAEADVADAIAVRGFSAQDSSEQWSVTLAFTPSGQRKWTRLTREAVVDAETCAPHARGGSGFCRVAIMLDNIVVAAPEIQSVTTGDTQIIGDFGEAEARLLAARLRSGALPAILSLIDVDVRRG